MKNIERAPIEISLNDWQNSLQNRYDSKYGRIGMHPDDKARLNSLITLLNKNASETQMLDPEMVNTLYHQADLYIDGGIEEALDRIVSLLKSE